ncbi:MAG TPA: phytanoyl-CoA dioxygenase family protein [Pseudonocardiaceae bacterium]|nr:phytanoyl-CoA dioxygenase family protein [Pseudonocardiaceae bacterium]
MNRVLTERETRQFAEDGYVVLEHGVPVPLIEELDTLFWSHVRAIEPRMPWQRPLYHLQEGIAGGPFEAAFTARVTSAVNDLLGPGRWQPIDWLGWWVVTYPGWDPPPWRPPALGWHVDGLYELAEPRAARGLPDAVRVSGRRRRPPEFRYRLNGREQGLVLIFLISDMLPGSGTAIVPASHRLACRHLRAAGAAGLSPMELQARLTDNPRPDGLPSPTALERLLLDLQLKRPIAGGHRGVLPPALQEQAVEVTGVRGDVLLLHPLILHATSSNTTDRPRIIANPWIELRADARLDIDRSHATPYELSLTDGW